MRTDEQMKPFHTKAGGIGIYHRLDDCRDARRIKPENRCQGNLADPHVEGCLWAGFFLDPCSLCGMEWPEEEVRGRMQARHEVTLGRQRAHGRGGALNAPLQGLAKDREDERNRHAKGDTPAEGG